MTTAALRVPTQPQRPQREFFDLVPMPGGATGQLTTPAATYNGKTYVGYVDPAGNIRVASYDHASGAVVLSPVIVSGLPANWHVAPAVLVRSSDHKIVVAVPGGGSTHYYIAISTNAEDVSAWGAATDIGSTLGSTDIYVFANLFQLSGESGKIYLCYATQGTTYYACVATSTDGGVTWSAQTKVYSTGTTTKPEFAFSSDGISRIDFLVADGQANVDSSCSMYHFYYSGGSYFKSNGTLISTALPLAPANITKVYDTSNGKVRAATCLLSNSGSPVAVWAAYNSGGSGFNENYWYGIFTGGAWVVNTITDAGAPLEVPGNAEGGVSPDPISPAIVYVSKKISGVWQIVVYTTPDNGVTWTSEQLTFDASQGGLDGNVKPNYPQNAVSALRCIWIFGVYGPQNIGSASNIDAAFRIRAYPKQ